MALTRGLSQPQFCYLLVFLKFLTSEIGTSQIVLSLWVSLDGGTSHPVSAFSEATLGTSALQIGNCEIALRFFVAALSSPLVQAECLSRIGLNPSPVVVVQCKIEKCAGVVSSRCCPPPSSG